MFVGKESAKFPPREINHLRMELTKGSWAAQGHASILMTMRYVHPAAEQKRLAMEKFEKYRAEQTLAAATVQQSHRVPTKVTTVERVN
jgi:hypothetical protein